MQVANLMTKAVRTCRIDDHLDCVARAMWDGDIGAVPVVDGDERLVGIVTDRDVCMAAYTQGKPLAAIPVTTAMAKDVVTCRPEDLVADVEWRMQTKQIRRLPVVDGHGRIAGVLSLNDIARRAEADRSKAARGVGLDEVAVTLAAICQPHGQPVAAASAVAKASAPAAPPRASKGNGKTKSAGA